GSFSTGRMGRDSAAPLLFGAFDLLAPAAGQLVRARPSGPAPAGVLFADATSELPLPLQRFGAATLATATLAPRGPEITFPLDGGRIALSLGGAVQPLELDAAGGRLPLLWLVNGEPVPSQSWKRRTLWQPD